MQEVGDKSSVAYVAKAMRKTCEVAGIEPLDVLVFEFPAKPQTPFPELQFLFSHSGVG